MKTKLVCPTYIHSLAGIVLAVVVLSAWNSSVASDVASSLKPILGEISTETSTTIDDLHHFFLSDSVLVIKTGKGYDENSQIEIRNPKTLEKLWAYKGKCHFYHISTGQNKVIVISQILYEGITKIKVFDIKGRQLFEKDNFAGFLLPSPNGTYFMSQYALVKHNKFYVFDRNGNELFSRERPAKYEWYATPFNDTIVVYITEENIDFIGVPSGNLIRSIPREKDPLYSYPGAVIAKNGDHMAFFWYKNLVYIGPGLEIKWQRTDLSPFYNGAFSFDGSFFAVYTGRESGNSVSLLETETGKTLWDEPIPADVVDGFTPYPGVSISEDLITVLNPQSSFFANGTLHNNSQTFLLKFEAKTGAFIRKVSVAGVTQLNKAGDKIITVSTVPDKGHTFDVKEWNDTSTQK